MISVRPSKIFQFEILGKELKNSTGDVGIDAATETMKTRSMFKTKKFYGVEHSLELLQRGVGRNNKGNTFGIYADIAKLDKIPEGCADVVVSTNTIFHLQGEDKISGLNHLCRITAPGGRFICDAIVGQELNDVLLVVNKYFKTIKIIYFANRFSLLYEKIFIKDGYMNFGKIAGSKPILALAWLISRFEYLTRSNKLLNKYSFIVCRDKISDKSNILEMSSWPLLEENIYNLMN